MFKKCILYVSRIYVKRKKNQYHNLTDINRWYSISMVCAVFLFLTHISALSLSLSVAHLIQLLPGLLLHPANVIHVQFNPIINPAEELPVEISKQALFLLLAERKK